MNTIRTLSIFAIGIFMFASGVLFADASQFQPIVPIPGITTEAGITITFAQYINKIFQIVISLSAILAVLVIIYGGFEYMTSSAGISKKNGMERIQGAVTGLLLLLSVTLILQIINPCILEITVLSGQTSEGCSRQVAASQSQTQSSGQGAGQQGSQGLGTGAYTPPQPSCISSRLPTSCPGGATPVTKCFANGVYSAMPEAGGCAAGGPMYICEGVTCVRDGAWRVVANESTQCQSSGDAILPVAHCCSIAAPTWSQFLEDACSPRAGTTACAGTKPNTVYICGGQRGSQSSQGVGTAAVSLQQLLSSRNGIEGSCTPTTASQGRNNVVSVCCNSARTDCALLAQGANDCVAPRATFINTCMAPAGN